MRFLVDENLSRRLPELLAAYGHDAVHVADAGLRSASDDEVLQAARRNDRILISADTDFGTLLAMERAEGPSVILIRREQHPVRWTAFVSVSCCHLALG